MKLLLMFTYGVSLQKWFDLGIIYREFEVYKQLLQRDVDISVITYGNKKDLDYADLIKPIQVTPVKPLVSSKFFKLAQFKAYLLPFRVRNLFRSVDIIKTNQMEGSLIACIAKLIFRKKLVIRCGWEWFRTYLSNYKIKKRKNIVKFVVRYIWMYLTEFFAYKLADGIILTSVADIRFIIQKFGLKKGKINLIYNFIDTDLFKPLEVPKKEKSVLFIGRLTVEKNLFNLIEAFQNLNSFSLDIIGKGPLKNELQRYADDLGVKVNFLGVKPNNTLPEIINQYQLFVLPSFYEGNPKVLLEAMSCGAVCLGTDVIGIQNIISHEENGYLCEPTAQSIRNAIVKIFKQKESHEKIRSHAREFILTNCSIPSVTEKEYQFYQQILKGFR